MSHGNTNGISWQPDSRGGDKILFRWESPLFCKLAEQENREQILTQSDGGYEDQHLWILNALSLDFEEMKRVVMENFQIPEEKLLVLVVGQEIHRSMGFPTRYIKIHYLADS
jgi:hypothetical protein